jgi:hypothetical protein
VVAAAVSPTIAQFLPVDPLPGPVRPPPDTEPPCPLVVSIARFLPASADRRSGISARYPDWLHVGIGCGVGSYRVSGVDEHQPTCSASTCVGAHAR